VGVGVGFSPPVVAAGDVVVWLLLPRVWEVLRSLVGPFDAWLTGPRVRLLFLVGLFVGPADLILSISAWKGETTLQFAHQPRMLRTFSILNHPIQPTQPPSLPNLHHYHCKMHQFILF
jgi:hypothetical protein